MKRLLTFIKNFKKRFEKKPDVIWQLDKPYVEL